MATFDDMNGQNATKRQRTIHGVHHSLRYRQSIPSATEAASQDPRIIQRQLDKGITTALAFAGFDSVTGSALHSLEALAEEFITDFLEHACISMLSARRNAPTPQDFTFALSQAGVTPSQLEEHLQLPIPHELSCPIIPPPAPEEQPPIDLKPVLGSDLCEPPQKVYPQIPVHFPPLPSKHAWRHTPHIAAREKDPRKLRERATQEGILAERSLRKLAQAASKPGSRAQRISSKAEQEKEFLWKDAVACLMADQSQSTQNDGDIDIMMTDGANESKAKVKAEIEQEDRAAMVVNYDRAHWRKGVSFGTVKT
ncbi:hypothetical protein C1H76_7064 [Elsinoe australis]|uniref:Transcription initiation factor TFIID subunit 8 n=1 Tax=Elsinoe australis TaxID=40998 RepID=A0A4U7AR13_9PEZI|nr:hypothetical protein C1H76_7064 [Elsinoe australis]